MRDDPNLWSSWRCARTTSPLRPLPHLMTDRLRAQLPHGAHGGGRGPRGGVPSRRRWWSPFALGVAERLVDDLRQVARARQDATLPGPYIRAGAAPGRLLSALGEPQQRTTRPIT